METAHLENSKQKLHFTQYFHRLSNREGRNEGISYADYFILFVWNAWQMLTELDEWIGGEVGVTLPCMGEGQPHMSPECEPFGPCWAQLGPLTGPWGRGHEWSMKERRGKGKERSGEERRGEERRGVKWRWEERSMKERRGKEKWWGGERRRKRVKKRRL